MSGGSDRGGRRWVRSGVVLWRRTPDGLVVLPRDAEDPLLVSGSGVAAWELLGTPRSLLELAELLSGSHDAARDRVLADLEPFLESLADAGALAVVS